MAKLKFNREKSLKEGEVILDEVQPEQEPVYVPMEIEVSADSEPTGTLASSCQPTVAELQLAQQLSGTPRAFDSEYQSVLESLARYGIAAYFNGDWGRGHKWHQFCK